MKVKNTTPFLFGPRVTSRCPPQPEMSLVVRGAFALRPGQPLSALEDQGALTADVFAPEDDDRRGECLYPSDFADFKLNAEAMLRGTCHAPPGKPVTECAARFAVGAWSKLLRVVGPRTWSNRTPEAVASKPLPFERLSLAYAHSFGGPGYEKNPVGIGMDTDMLPRIERAGEPVRSRLDRPDPACFGPLNPAWAQRAGRVGTQYGGPYRQKRAPYFAEDFDFRYFHAAPGDQQIPGYLRGDEDVVVEGLHPDVSAFSARLPALRLRAFVKDVRARFREVPMNLDTLFVDADAGLLFLTWRGLDPVEEDDLADVSVVRIAAESMADEKVALDRYRAETDAFEADPVGIRDALPPEMADLLERQEAEHTRGLSPDEPNVGSVARRSSLFEGMLGGGGAAPDVRAKLVEAQRTGKGPAPPLIPLKPGSTPVMKIGAPLRAQRAALEETKRQAAARGQTVRGLEALEALFEDPRLRQIDPTFKPSSIGERPPDEPGPGRDLSGRDFTERDLRGADLTGANLEGAIFTRAQLQGAILVRANLAYAVLYEAELAGADFTEANLTLALVARASAGGARFDGATLEQASFEKADLMGASLVGAKGEYVRFSEAKLDKAKAARCSLPHSHFDRASLEHADLSESIVSACLFLDARAGGLLLAGATLTRSSFEGADLRGAVIKGAKGDAVAWMRAKLDDADLGRSWITGGHFIEVSANRTSFVEANLRDAKFHRATAQAASFMRANLFSADFGKTTLTDSSFAGANLYDAKFLGATHEGCDFDSANMKRAVMETKR